ncbi:MAG TPA: hypothetical protein VF192_02270 [Longimicrobiales bacterium]
MLTNRELTDLYRRLRQANVLSVYLDADQHDPAERDAWRRRLNRLAARARRGLAEAPGERDAFDAALARVEERLAAYDAFLPGRGWVAFASPDRLWYAQAVPVPLPNVVVWGRGMRVAPLVRGLKQMRPVAALLLDRRRARLFRYLDGVLSEPVDMLPDLPPPDISDVYGAKCAGAHTGRRGATRADLRSGLAEMAAERLARASVEKAVGLAGDDGFLVLGGTAEMVAMAARQLPRTMAGRVIELPSLYVTMPAAELKDALEAAASAHSRKRQEGLVAAALDDARAGGLSTLGREGVEHALREGRVETLFVSRALREHEPDLAEEYIGAALEQGAKIEEVTGAAAEALEGEAEGVAARLRYRCPEGVAGAV